MEKFYDRKNELELLGKIDMELLGEKARQFSNNIPDYAISLEGLSMEDM